MTPHIYFLLTLFFVMACTVQIALFVAAAQRGPIRAAELFCRLVLLGAALYAAAIFGWNTIDQALAA